MGGQRRRVCVLILMMVWKSKYSLRDRTKKRDWSVGLNCSACLHCHLPFSSKSPALLSVGGLTNEVFRNTLSFSHVHHGRSHILKIFSSAFFPSLELRLRSRRPLLATRASEPFVVSQRAVVSAVWLLSHLTN